MFVLVTENSDDRAVHILAIQSWIISISFLRVPWDIFFNIFSFLNGEIAVTYLLIWTKKHNILEQYLILISQSLNNFIKKMNSILKFELILECTSCFRRFPPKVPPWIDSQKIICIFQGKEKLSGNYTAVHPIERPERITCL